MALVFRIAGIVAFVLGLYLGYDRIVGLAFVVLENMSVLDQAGYLLTQLIPAVMGLIGSLICFGMATMLSELAFMRRYMRWMRSKLPAPATQADESEYLDFESRYAPPRRSPFIRQRIQPVMVADGRTLPGRNVPTIGSRDVEWIDGRNPPHLPLQ